MKKESLVVGFKDSEITIPLKMIQRDSVFTDLEERTVTFTLFLDRVAIREAAFLETTETCSGCACEGDDVCDQGEF